MSNTNITTDNLIEETYLVSEILITKTTSKFKKVEVSLNTTENTADVKKLKTRKKGRSFSLSLEPSQPVSRFTVYMHPNPSIQALLRNQQQEIIEQHVGMAEHFNQGDIDHDDAKMITWMHNATTIGVRLTNDVLLPTTQGYPRFRIVVIGNTGVGKSSLINVVFGLSGTDSAPAMVSDLHVGEADIEREIMPADNRRLVLHDSRGFEAGEGGNLNTVMEFIKSRNRMENPQDRLHAVWLCLRIPVAGGSLAEAGIEKLLAMRENGDFGDIPFIVVYTQYDKLIKQVKYELRHDINKEKLVDKKVEELFEKFCLTPLQPKEGNIKFLYARVSTQDGYRDTIQKLVELTLENVNTNLSDESRHALAMAQRVIPWLKIQTSIDVGRAKYWKSIFMGTVFKGHSLEECLRVLHTDIIAVWNLSDEYCYLRSRKFQVLLYGMVQDVFRTAPLGSPSQGQVLATNLNMAGQAVTFASGVAGGAAAVPIVVPIAVVLALLQWVLKLYSDSHDVQKCFMAYVIDLILVMQNIFLVLQAQSRPTSIEIWMIKFAMRTYEMSPIKAQIHTAVVDFVDQGGISDHARDDAVNKIVGMIEQYRKESAELIKKKMTEEDPSEEENLRTWGVELT